MGHQVDKYTSQLHGQDQAGVPHVVQPQDHRHTGGWDLTDLSDDGVHQACWGEVIHQVKEAQGAEVSPVSQWLSLSTSGDKIIRVRQLVIDKAVGLNPLSELVSLTADHHRLVITLSQQGNLTSANISQDTPVSHHPITPQQHLGHSGQHLADSRQQDVSGVDPSSYQHRTQGTTQVLDPSISNYNLDFLPLSSCIQQDLLYKFRVRVGEDHISISDLLISCFRYCFWMKGKVDINKVVHHLLNTGPSLFKYLMALLIDMDKGLHCFKKVMLGFIMLSISLYSSVAVLSEGSMSRSRVLKAIRREMHRPELPTIFPSANWIPSWMMAG